MVICKCRAYTSGAVNGSNSSTDPRAMELVVVGKNQTANNIQDADRTEAVFVRVLSTLSAVDMKSASLKRRVPAPLRNR